MDELNSWISADKQVNILLDSNCVLRHVALLISLKPAKCQRGVKFQNKEESNLQSLTFQLKDQSSMIMLTTIHVLQHLNKAASTRNTYLVG